MSPRDLPEYLQADYHQLPEHRRDEYLLAMLECVAIAEGRAERVPIDPERRRVFGEAMNHPAPRTAELPGPIPAGPTFEPGPEDRAAAAAMLDERRAEADEIARWLAEAPFPSPMPPGARARGRTPYRPVSDRDVARVGAV